LSAPEPRRGRALRVLKVSREASAGDSMGEEPDPLGSREPDRSEDEPETPENADRQTFSTGGPGAIPPLRLSGLPVPAPDWRAAGRELAADVGEIVTDLQQTVAGLAAREQELQRREREVAEEYRRLLDKARAAARAEIEAEYQALTRERALLQARVVSPEAVPRGVPEPTRRSWLRSTILAAVAGTLVAGWWLAGNPPRYQVSVELLVSAPPPTSTPSDAGATWGRRLLAEHRADLLDPQWLANAPLAEDVRRVWFESWARGQGQVVVDEEQMALRVALAGPKPDVLERALKEVSARYAEHANQEGRDARLPAQYLEQVLWRDELRAALEDARRREKECAARLAALPELKDRPTLAQRADTLRSELTAADARLETARAGLTTLLARDDPRGVVDETAVEDALRSDPMYAEDRRELHACAQKYRTELTVALLLVAEPLKAMQKVLNEYAAAIREQQDLRPSAALAAILNACAADVTGAAEALATFVEAWRLRVAEVQQAELSPERVETVAPELVQRQGEAARAVQDFAREAAAALGANGERLSQIVGGGSTREVVVGASLRGHHSTWSAAVEALTAAAARTTLNGNVELEALERQLRGVLTRLHQRREFVQQRLQVEADRIAREQHAEQVAAARVRVRELEGEREKIIAAILDVLTEARGADEVAAQRAELEAGRAQARMEIERLARQLGTVEERLAAAGQWATRRDRVEVGRIQTAALPEARYRKAVVLGLGAGAVAWLMCFLMVSRWPRRAPPVGVAANAEEAAATEQ